MTNLKLERFVVARDDDAPHPPENWIEGVRRVPGVYVLDGQVSDVRVLVTATDAGIVRLRERFGNTLLIEKIVPHKVAS